MDIGALHPLPCEGQDNLDIITFGVFKVQSHLFLVPPNWVIVEELLVGRQGL